jgi:hypothetical protein
MLSSKRSYSETMQNFGFLHSNKKIRWFGRFFFDLPNSRKILYHITTIFQIFFCPILAKFCNEMSQNFLLNSRKIFCQKPTHFFDFVVVWQKFCGNLISDFRKTADHNFFRRTNVLFLYFVCMRAPSTRNFFSNFGKKSVFFKFSHSHILRPKSEFCKD